MTNIKNLRLERGVTQQQLASLLGITRGAYSNIENGKREPDISTLIQLSDYFNVTIDYLVNNTENRMGNMRSTDENNFLTSDQAFISNISEALGLDINLFIAMALEMTAEDIKVFLTPSIYVPAEPKYRLKRARFSAGLRQTDMAETLGISRDEYREYESGEKFPSHKMIVDISNLLNVNLDWLCCCIKYIDPQTKRAFDPGIYKLFVDSAYDPIDRKLDLFEIHSPLEDQNQSAICNMLSMYLKLDPSDQGEIRGEIRAFLKAEKYSPKEGWQLA